jgi:hypothetical protein
MKTTAKWLKQCARGWLSRSRTRRSCSIKPSILERLEDRAFPGGGMLTLGHILARAQDDATKPNPAESAATRRLALGSSESKTELSRLSHTEPAAARRPRASASFSPTTTVSLTASPAGLLNHVSGGNSSRVVPSSRGSGNSPAREGARATNRARIGNPAAQTSGYRPIDEVGNNAVNPTLGTAGTDLLRVSPEAYSDGVSSPSLATNSSARVISDILNNQADPANPSTDLNTVDRQSLSDFGYAFGQFIDHDLDLTPTDPNQTLQILADPSDPSQMGNQTFARSVFDASTGTRAKNPRQQTNAVTSFLDLSQVYGSSAAVADALRTHSGGLMKTSPGGMLPYDNSSYFTPAQLAVINMANDSGAVATGNLFVTGDVRGNENVELTALQTLFVRNHNLIAGELQKEHPGWSDEQLYQEARKINIAEYQAITYDQYLPDLLGPNALSKYTGYRPNVDPSIATEFSTVAFRFGHSLLSSEIERQGNNGLDVLPSDPAGASISLATDFFDPNVLNPAGTLDPLTGHNSTDIGPILKADADGVAQADDLMAIGDVRNLLFANGG